MNIDFLSLHFLHQPQALPSSLVWEKWQGFFNMRGALQGLKLNVLHFMWRRCSRQESSLLWRTSLQSICVFVPEETSHPYRCLPLSPGFCWCREPASEFQEYEIWSSWAFLWRPQAWEVFFTFTPTCGYLHCGAQLIRSPEGEFRATG